MINRIMKMGIKDRVRLAMKEVRDATAHILDNTTLAVVNRKLARKRCS